MGRDLPNHQLCDLGQVALHLWASGEWQGHAKAKILSGEMEAKDCGKGDEFGKGPGTLHPHLSQPLAYQGLALRALIYL